MVIKELQVETSPTEQKKLKNKKDRCFPERAKITLKLPRCP